jgi:pheromone shutdown protein TraB
MEIREELVEEAIEHLKKGYEALRDGKTKEAEAEHRKYLDTEEKLSADEVEKVWKEFKTRYPELRKVAIERGIPYRKYEEAV